MTKNTKSSFTDRVYSHDQNFQFQDLDDIDKKNRFTVSKIYIFFEKKKSMYYYVLLVSM